MASRGRGEGSIHRRKDGLWSGQVSLGFDGQGRRVRPTVYGKTKREVQQKLMALQRDALKGLPVKPERITVDQHFEDWLRTKKSTTRPSTFTSYCQIYNGHVKPAFGSTLMKALDYRRINALYEKLDDDGLSKRTVAYVGSILRAGLDDAVRKGLIPQNPARLSARRTYQSHEARCLNQDELRRFLQAARGERLEEAFILAIHTGLRPGELLGLTWDAVDFEGRRLTVKQALHEDGAGIYMGDVKTKAGRRTISLSKAAVAAIKAQKKRQAEDRLAAGQLWQNPSGLIFTNHEGGPLRRTNIMRRDLRRVVRKVGLQGVTLHTFRHTHASILIFQGVDIKAISRRLGHEKITMTLQVYGHLLPGQDERAADRMDDFAQVL